MLNRRREIIKAIPWQEVPFTPGYIVYYANGGTGANTAYISVPFVQTKGKTQWKILYMNNITNTGYKRCQLFNGDTFVKAVALQNIGRYNYNNKTYYAYSIPEIETATQFRFHFYPKASGENSLIILAR